ncbi:MAG: hypothetical protein HYZ45_00975, partial [Burkholderiales bacterium]|nr:hypothetical protein [Burkholderiales bacterium]
MPLLGKKTPTSLKPGHVSNDSKHLVGALLATLGFFFLGWGLFDLSLHSWRRTGLAGVGMGCLILLAALLFFKSAMERAQNIEYFDFQGIELRVLQHNGESLFFAEDILRALGIEGPTNQRRLNKAPWGRHKTAIKSAKWLIWTAVALVMAATFVAYFTPARSLVGETLGFALGPWETFWIVFYGFATYGNAGYMREQVCKYMCPYARFQSAMFDRNTLIVSYDARRGEPR